jgi:two-component system phosphate regulon sensor histidine kinase PhoR
VFSIPFFRRPFLSYLLLVGAISVAIGSYAAACLRESHIERAISNLIDNAIKYTPEQGIIRVSAKIDEKYMIVEVSDNGIGISGNDLPRIFERFYRVDKSRSREAGGTGLGLSIVKHVAQVHGGAVEVSSVSGQGSTFRFKIPLA